MIYFLEKIFFFNKNLLLLKSEFYLYSIEGCERSEYCVED